jgi:hypothetical protein
LAAFSTLLAATLALSTLTPEQTAAQEFSGGASFFFGIPRDERYPAPPSRYQPFAYASPSGVPDVGPPLSLGPSSRPAIRSTYCVRLCHGRFFPLSDPAAASSATAAKTCSAMCPASKTAIYRGGKIDDATANNSDPYADLVNAFVYRQQIVPDCTCNGKNGFGLAPVDIAKDPTLRPGDIVATAEGLKVFKGSNSETYKTADYAPIGRTSLTSADMRRRLVTMRVMQTR